MTPFKIGSKTIGPGQPTFVIAEIGVNHDGSIDRALELTQIAADCGADAVKLQIFRASQLMHSSSAFATYQKDRCPDSDPAAMLRRYELTASELQQVVTQIRKLGLIPLATPFSLPDVESIRQLDLPAIKIASPDLVNLPLLHRSAQLNKPLLLSTGAATLDEIATTIGWLREWKTPFALLHCISSYPTPPEEAQIGWITEMMVRFGVPVGFSDHTGGILGGALGVAAGAFIIEKHLTYDRSAPGPDHAASSDPKQFATYIQLIREAEKMRGIPGKRVLDIEQDVRKVSRQSLIAARDLQPGHVIVEADLTVQRPGTGIPAADFFKLIGARVKRLIPAGEMLQWAMLSSSCDDKS